MVRYRTTTICLLATGLVAFACGACSVLFATNKDQCATDDDCRSRGFASTRCSVDNVCVATDDIVRGDASVAADAADATVDPFACASLPAPSPDPSKQVDIAIRFTDFSTGAPPEDTLVRLCAASDPNCQNARATVDGGALGDAGPEGGTGWVTPQKDGLVGAKVEYGFEGFFEVRAPQYQPTFRSTSPALRNPSNYLEQLLLRPAEIKFLADQALGMPGSYDSVNHGLVFVLARDCTTAAVGGASFTTNAMDPKLQVFYIINSAPSIQDTKTDSLGRGGFLNVPPGIHTFTAFRDDGTKRLGSGTVLVRAGSVTTIAIDPSP
jgi:hypothetical protein